MMTLLFYREFKITEDLLQLKTTLSKYQPEPVIFARTHGAIESLLVNAPSTHICYERKGFGVHQDMEIEDWAFNATDINFDHTIDTNHAQNELSGFGKKITNRPRHIEAKTVLTDNIIKGTVR